MKPELSRHRNPARKRHVCQAVCLKVWGRDEWCRGDVLLRERRKSRLRSLLPLTRENDLRVRVPARASRLQQTPSQWSDGCQAGCRRRRSSPRSDAVASPSFSLHAGNDRQHPHRPQIHAGWSLLRQVFRDRGAWQGKPFPCRRSRSRARSRICQR